MKAPFPYFGGKSAVAKIVWGALGQVEHYIEPFFGSGAVLLARPGVYPNSKYTETVCEIDGYLANVWRALQADPDEVAKWCDWPVNQADLAARKARLLRNEERLLENLISDDEWFDAKMAGYWVWAASCWIGSGLTSPGRQGQTPHLADKGRGVHGAGKIPHLADKGRGVHGAGKIPQVGTKGRGVHGTQNSNIYDWFRRLQERLRYVRVVCGDWSKVCGGDWQDKTWSTVGMFFDPPYGVEDRDAKLYHRESQSAAADVRAWVLERGKRRNYRIVLAGYIDEHEDLIDVGWTVHRWKTTGGYGNTARNDDSAQQGQRNRHREALFFSPYCLGNDQLKLFDS